MAYADSIRTTNPTFENVASLIDGQLISYQLTSVDAGPTSFAADGYLTSADITVTVAAGESVFLLGHATFTNGTINSSVTMKIRESTSDIFTAYGYSRSFRASSDGLDQMLIAQGLRTPSAGSKTYQLYFARQAATTAYIRLASLLVVKFRSS